MTNISKNKREITLLYNYNKRNEDKAPRQRMDCAVVTAYLIKELDSNVL